jgi:hypothetical protein
MSPSIGALFIVAAALTPPPVAAQQGGRPAQADASSTASETTLIGCVVRLDTSARRPGTSDPIPAGHPGQPASSGFALKDAIVSTGEEPARGPIETRSEREFGIARGKVSVERSAGQQVLIKGRLTSTARSGDASADAKPAVPGHNAMIDVTAVRSLSDTCPPPR